MNTGLVLPANTAEQASLAALETLEGRTAATFADAAAGFDPLCRYVLFAGPDSDTVLATNLTGRELEGALRCWHSEPSGRVFYPLFSRRGTLADGSVCLLVYTFSMPYASRALQGVLPDFQLLGLGVLAGLEGLVVALTTRRTARRRAGDQNSRRVRAPGTSSRRTAPPFYHPGARAGASRRCPAGNSRARGGSASRAVSSSAQSARSRENRRTAPG